MPVWFHFNIFRAWIAYTLGKMLRQKREAPTKGVGIPVTYSQLDVG